jgi:hypothetical protein
MQSKPAFVWQTCPKITPERPSPIFLSMGAEKGMLWNQRQQYRNKITAVNGLNQEK